MKEGTFSNRQLRARKDLLQAAARLTKDGGKPTMDEVAKEALISRATAYRYFKNIEALLLEAPLDAAVGNPEAMFEGDDSTDPEKRIDAAEAAMHEVCYRNEGQLRVMLANSIGRDPGEKTGPVRQNRRTDLIEAALSTSKERFSAGDYKTLRAALAIVFGTESMIVCQDVLGIDEKTAREVKSWAVRALVRAGLEG
jgi:AcrR family transcriptional regulator